jgi:hypothetical protein
VDGVPVSRAKALLVFDVSSLEDLRFTFRKSVSGPVDLSKNGQTRRSRSASAATSRRGHRRRAETEMAELYLGFAGQVARGKAFPVQVGCCCLDFCEFG